MKKFLVDPSRRQVGHPWVKVQRALSSTISAGNVYDRVIQNMDRTNNHVETAHRQVELQMHHSTTGKLIDGQG